MRALVLGVYRPQGKDWKTESWDEARDMLRTQYGFSRTSKGVKSEWARHGRARTGIDERNVKGKDLVTSREDPKDRREKRKAKNAAEGGSKKRRRS